MDDRLFLETTDTIFYANQLIPGTHEVSVSAVYSDGESRWIGPEEVFVPGAPLNIPDPALSKVIRQCLGYASPDNQELRIFEGELSRITSLDIDQSVSNMEGLGLCNHLKRLVIN